MSNSPDWQVQVLPLAALLLWLGSCHIGSDTHAADAQSVFRWAIPSDPTSVRRNCTGCRRSGSFTTMPPASADAPATACGRSSGRPDPRQENTEDGVPYVCLCPALAEHAMDGATWVASVFCRVPLGTRQGILWAVCLSASYLAAVSLFKRWVPWDGPLPSVAGGSPRPIAASPH
jgi:hypothetical protein